MWQAKRNLLKKASYGAMFSSIAGYERQKEEARKIVDRLKRADVYAANGVTVPKGLVIYGDPGVGKTLMAKAIANEAGVPFFAFDALEKKALALEEVFRKAKENKPSILFIDEVDQYLPGMDYEGYYGGGRYQSEETRGVLKTLLTQIDGLESSDGMLVIATANNGSVLPKALLRSGRLEKEINLPLPDVNDRRAIIGFYLAKHHLLGIDVKLLAEQTSDFTGADLKALVDEAISASVRLGRPATDAMFEEQIPIIRFGSPREQKATPPNSAVAWHEIGHFLCHYDLTGKMAALSAVAYGYIEGFMDPGEEFDDPTAEFDGLSAKKMTNIIVISLGGMAGETVFLHERYCGSMSDLSAAKRTAETLMANAVFGFDCIFDVPPKIKVQGMPKPQIPLTCKEKERDILRDCLNQAERIVSKWRDLGEALYEPLMEEGRLSKRRVREIVKEFEETTGRRWNED